MSIKLWDGTQKAPRVDVTGHPPSRPSGLSIPTRAALRAHQSAK